MTFRRVLLLLLLPALCWATSGTRPIIVYDALPGHCTIGDGAYLRTTTAGLNVYFCTSTDTWQLEGDGAAGAATPGACSAGQFEIADTGSGPTCDQVDFADLSGSAIDSQIPNNITIDLATAASHLNANGTNCTSGDAAGGVDASGNAEDCFTPSGGGGSPHNLLDASQNQDTVAKTADMGDVIFGDGSNWDTLSGDITDKNVFLHEKSISGSPSIPDWSGVYFTMLIGTAVDAQIPDTITINGTGNVSLSSIVPGSDDQALVSNGTTFQAKTIPDCTDATGNHLNYTQATNAFSCGTTGVAGTSALLSATHTDTVAHTVVLGDILYGNSTPAWQALSGNISTTRKYLQETGSGTISVAPAWTQPSFSELQGAVTDAQVPDNITINGTGNVSLASITGTTDDAVLVNSGAAWQEKVLTTCTGAGKAVTYNASTNAFGCNTITSGSTSPLTTKGDLWGFSTVDAAVPVGTDGQLLSADSASTPGVKWIDPATANANTISPSTLSADTNDWNPTGLSTARYIRVCGDASFRAITGLTARAAGTLITMLNVCNNTLLLPDANTNSSAANRFQFQGYDQPLFPRQAITLYYDGTDSRWTLAGPQQVIPTARYGYYLRSEMTIQAGATGTSPIPNGASFDGIWFVGVGNSGSVQGSATVTANHPGQVSLRTNAGTTAIAAVTLGSNLATSVVLFGGSTYWRWDSQVLISAVSTSSQRHTDRFGMLALAGGSDTDGCYFRIVDNVNSGHILLVCRSGGTETTTNTSTDPTYGSYDRYTITVNPAASIVEFFMNGTSLGTVTAHIPTATVSGCAWSIIKSVGATSIALAVDDVEIIMYQPTMN